MAAAAAAGAPGPAAQLLSYPDGLDSWPERMRPLVQWGEAANMRDRVPLHSRLLDLAGAAGGEHPLMATRIADLHPISWCGREGQLARARQGTSSWPGHGWRGLTAQRCARLAQERVPSSRTCFLPGHTRLASPSLSLPTRRFAVAWYPLYRVPEAPLTARFLTFHTLASL